MRQTVFAGQGRARGMGEAEHALGRPLPAHAVWDVAGDEWCGTLDDAFDICRRVAQQHSRTFYMASQLFPAPQRRAVWAFYALCRYIDDLVDCPHDTATVLASVDLWQQRVQSDDHAHPILLAYAHTRDLYRLPPDPILDLFAGVRMDLLHVPYRTWEDLRVYCLRVASSVGVGMSYLIGFHHPAALDHARDLGLAMQLTNILRDVGEDAARGRIYLPLDDLAMVGYTVDDLRLGVCDERLRALLDIEIARARSLFASAWGGIELLKAEGRLPVAFAALAYSRILDSIVQNGYDVMTTRAHLSQAAKLSLLPRAIWHTRQMGRHRVTRPPALPQVTHLRSSHSGDR